MVVNSDACSTEALLKRLLRPLGVCAWAAVVSISPAASGVTPGPVILTPENMRRHVGTFNRHDHTHFGQAISNEKAAEWMEANVPFFDCPDKEIAEIYDFRWWTFRKHIKETADGFVITEFLPQVTWSGKHNTISCPAGHHFREAARAVACVFSPMARRSVPAKPSDA